MVARAPTSVGCKRYFSDGTFDTLTSFDLTTLSLTFTRSQSRTGSVTISVIPVNDSTTTVAITSDAGETEEILQSWCASAGKRLVEPIKTYDDPILGAQAARVAEQADAVINMKSLPLRTYMDQNITPLLLQGMNELVKLRPENPVEWLSIYLFQNNPHPHPPRDD